MQRLQLLLEKHSRWQPLDAYIKRIHAYADTDFGICVENAKSMLESIAREVCTDRAVSYERNEHLGKLLKKAMGCFQDKFPQELIHISGALSNIGQHIGVIRNHVGEVSHGKTMDELRDNSILLNKVSLDFLLSTTENIACLLIDVLENFYPRKAATVENSEDYVYEDHADFNGYFDEAIGDVVIGLATFKPSEILYEMDFELYKAELEIYRSLLNETNNGE